MFEILTIFRKLYFLEFKFGLKFDWIWKPWWKFKIKCKSQNSKSSTPERDVFLLEIPLRFCAFNSPVPRWHMQYFLSLLKMRDMNAVSQGAREWIGRVLPSPGTVEWPPLEGDGDRFYCVTNVFAKGRRKLLKSARWEVLLENFKFRQFHLSYTRNYSISKVNTVTNPNGSSIPLMWMCPKKKPHKRYEL